MKPRTVSTLLSVSLLFTLLVGNAYADTSVGAKIGTLGLGVEVIKPLEKVDLRFGVNKFDYNHNDTLDGTPYDVDLGMQTVSALVDWRPAQNGFFVSGGAMLNNNKLDATATANNTDIGGANLVAGTITSGISFDDVSPYLGVGYRSKATEKKGWGFTAEAGVLAQGKPKVDLTTSDAAFNVANAAAIEQEKANIRKDLDALEYMPVISIGAVYNF